MSKEPTYTCPNCGGDIIGDGYNTAQHCEFADESLYDDHEPDSKPVYCKIDPCDNLDMIRIADESVSYMELDTTPRPPCEICGKHHKHYKINAQKLQKYLKDHPVEIPPKIRFIDYIGDFIRGRKQIKYSRL